MVIDYAGSSPAAVRAALRFSLDPTVLRRRFASLASLAFTVALFGRPANADTRDVRDLVRRLRDQWTAGGGRTTVVAARFLFDDETALVAIPPETGGRASECTQIAVIGARGLGFRARLSDVPVDPLVPPEPGSRASSVAGVLELRRCGKDRPPIHHVVVTSEAGRGTVEVVVARVERPLPSLGSLLPERTGGVLPPPNETGALPPLGPQEKRAERAEARARRDGATIQPRFVSKNGAGGTGEDELVLDAGCHRIEVFGRELVRERPGSRFRLDLDAELRDGERLLARDRTEAPDARLETCVGGPTHVLLVHAGAPPGSDVVVTRATWSLPAHLPAIWGIDARSKMARVMFLRHVSSPSEDPVYLTQGVTGTTTVPLSVETGGCYVAVAGIGRGRVRQLQLRASVGARDATDERGVAEEAALTAFCVGAHEPVRLEVVARGSGVAWGLAVFRVQSGVWEMGR